MTSENTLEVRRQLFHLILGCAIAVSVWILKPVIGNLILIPLFAALTILLAIPKMAPKLMISNKLLTHFERKKDVKRFPYKGAIFYGIGISFPIMLLNTELACVVILILSIGDAFSTLIGRFYGKQRIGNKTIEGTLAFIMFSLAGCLLFLRISNSMAIEKTTIWLVLLGALIELQEKVDDNLAVPITLSLVARLLNL
jgi:dolichol kinase